MEKTKQSQGSVKGESNTRIYHDISYLHHDILGPRKREQGDSVGNVLTQQRKRKIELFQKSLVLLAPSGYQI